jgi:hypothetical protein
MAIQSPSGMHSSRGMEAQLLSSNVEKQGSSS